MNEDDDLYLSYLKNDGNADYVIRYTLNRRLTLIGDNFDKDFYNMIIEGKHLSSFDICVYSVSVDCQIYLGHED
jgi:hypothetical protein